MIKSLKNKVYDYIISYQRKFYGAKYLNKLAELAASLETLAEEVQDKLVKTGNHLQENIEKFGSE